MNIIVKKYDHYNRALGKQITSRSHYNKEMAKAGCEPYKPGEVRIPKPKQYQVSQWAKDITRTAINQLNNGGQVGGVVKEQIARKLNAKDPAKLDKRIRNATKGGTYAE